MNTRRLPETACACVRVPLGGPRHRHLDDRGVADRGEEAFRGLAR